MSSHASKFALVLLAGLAFASHAASASVLRVGNASFLVSVQVVASCRIDLDPASAATTSETCSDGSIHGQIAQGAASRLANPTDDEAAAGAGLNSVSITY